MTIAFTCPNCLTDLRLNDQYAGECVKCPRCHGLMVVPDEVGKIDSASATPPEPSVYQPPVDNWQAHLRPSRGASAGTPGTKPRQPEAPPAERVKFFCTSCGTKMSADTSAAGRQVTCPSCKTRQQIPGGRNADTASARADDTPTRSLAAPYLTGNPRAMVSNSDSLIDALDDVDLAEARAPVASPFLTGYTAVSRQNSRPRHWLLSWSTILVAAGTLLGLLLVWGAVSAPALYHDHVLPYFNKHVAPAIGTDPARQTLQLSNELIDVGDKMTESLRQTHDVESARTHMPVFIENLLRLCTLEQSVLELREKARGTIPTKEQEKELEALKHRMTESQTRLKIESARCQKIPGVALVMANALSEAISRDTTGNLAESLGKSPQGRAFLAFSGHSAAKNNAPTDTAPLPVAPPRPMDSPARHSAPNTAILEHQDASPAASARPQPQFAATRGIGNSDTLTAPESPPTISPAASAPAQQLIAALTHLAALQKMLLERSQQITDVRSLRMNAVPWTGAARMWQSQEAAVEKLAGQELLGDDAQRYADAKETNDRQRGQLIAEFDRLEKLGALPQLNARLVRHGGKALGSGSVADDDDNDTKKPLKRSSPRALKRITTP